MHGGHPAETSATAGDLRRGADDPPVRFQEGREQDEGVPYGLPDGPCSTVAARGTIASISHLVNLQVAIERVADRGDQLAARVHECCGAGADLSKIVGAKSGSADHHAIVKD